SAGPKRFTKPSMSPMVANCAEIANGKVGVSLRIASGATSDTLAADFPSAPPLATIAAALAGAGGSFRKTNQERKLRLRVLGGKCPTQANAARYDGSTAV